MNSAVYFPALSRADEAFFGIYKLDTYTNTTIPILETLPPIWEPDGTASRILGEEAALEAAKQTPKRDAAARRADIQKKLQQSGSHLTNKKRKQLKKADRKLANEERKRCDQPKDHRDHSGNEGVEINAPPNMQSLSI